ncbi:MAG: transposase [Hymenobacter sp.]
MFATFGDLLKYRHLEARYVLDSFPVAVCHNTRIPRCKLLTGKAYHGRCASKRSWFYGLKVQVVATSTMAFRSSFTSMPGPSRSRPGGAACRWTCRAGSVLYTDAGYTDYVAEDLFNEASGNQPANVRGATIASGRIIRHKAF